MTTDKTTRRPGQPTPASQPADFDPVRQGKALLRRIQAGALATLDRRDGGPFASLVNVATDFDGSPLLLLSKLAAHRANIEADPRISLLLAETGKGDPLAHARLTVTGRAEPAGGEAVQARCRERFLAKHPKSALYAGFADFGFFRVAIGAGHLNGGFARAAELSAAELTTDCSQAAALMEAAPGALAHMNADHADAVRLYATRLLGGRDGPWRMTGLDPEGADLAFAGRTLRLAFPEPVHDAQALRGMLVRLTREARSAADGPAGPP
ncbi:HugZ family pyridoxamine 5'-phosphate oxidase [Labrys monachus]|uniref:Heme iron utilization protein n=1 Tax=Labrys monachus TaxID=217067 RepID=A0ABU0FMZ0_9HYPH|nr:DUF2470 domain-containing protein [Labrys monachus]MDQ0395415.1 putative heme iron utilization protein [Labrys monachus]